MAHVQYVDTILQEMKVKSANNRKIIFDGEVNDSECLKACYYLDKLMSMDRVSGSHLFPFRTEKLSPPAPMVLQCNAGE